jgi:nucleotide-binding universal stress UspA family protein
MFSKILVPLDGSELSERALVPAFALAQRPGSMLTLLRVPLARTGLVTGLEAFDSHIRGWTQEQHTQECLQAETYLEALKATHTRAGYNVETCVPNEGVLDSILELAKRHDLIVMSTHGYSGLTKLMMGSVTERVLAAAECPVLVIRSTKPIRHILVPLDGSELSETALAPALETAGRFNAAVTLFRAVDEVTKLEQVQLTGLGETDIATRLLDRLMKGAENYLNTRVIPPETALHVSREAVVSNTPGFRILDYAERHETDLIVMATHGRTGLARWIYGSVTEKVLRNWHSSMLIIRPPLHRLH